MSKRQETDLQLLQRARTGDSTAFTALYLYYRGYIFNKIYGMVGNRLDAEDLTSEVFEKLLRNLDKYRPTYTFSAWVRSVATNHTLDFIARQHIKWADIESAAAQYAPDPTPAEIIIIGEDRRMLESMFRRLTAKQSACVRMFYYEDYSYKEISTEFGLELNNVCALVHRGRQTMRELLTKKCA
jgi:RNA polymerase sigma-70 factor (ECF subfamily)